MILECPQDAHRGSSERYLDMCATCKVALNRHGSRPWIVLVGEGAVGRVARAYGGSNTPCLTPLTPVLGSLREPNRARLRARSKEFSRRRRTFIQVYHHRLQSNDSGVSARRSPGLFGAISRPTRDTQSCSKSPWISHVDSIGWKGGRGPRPSGLWRLKHAVLARTYTCSGLPTAGPLERIFAPKAHFLPGVSPPTTVR